MKKNIIITLLVIISCISILYGFFENRKVARLENEIIKEKEKLVKYENIQRKNVELANLMRDKAILEDSVFKKAHERLK